MLQLHLVVKCTQRELAEKLRAERKSIGQRAGHFTGRLKLHKVVLTTGCKLKTVMEKSKYNY